MILHVVDMGHAQIACEGAGIVSHRFPSPGNADAKEHNDHQGNTHDNALDQVRGGYGHETAQNRITDNDNSACDHGNMIVHAKQTVKQCSHCLETRCRIGDEEDQDHNGGNAHQYILFITVAP